MNQTAVLLMIKKIPLSLQSTLSLGCIRVIPSSPTRITLRASTVQAVARDLPHRVCSSVEEAAQGDVKELLQSHFIEAT